MIKSSSVTNSQEVPSLELWRENSLLIWSSCLNFRQLEFGTMDLSIVSSTRGVFQHSNIGRQLLSDNNLQLQETFWRHLCLMKMVFVSIIGSDQLLNVQQAHLQNHRKCVSAVLEHILEIYSCSFMHQNSYLTHKYIYLYYIFKTQMGKLRFREDKFTFFCISVIFMPF